MKSKKKFKDASRKLDTVPSPSNKKIYPRFTVDLDQNKGIKAGLDDKIELHLKGRVSRLEKGDYGHSMEVEVQSIAHGGNSADKELAKMKSSRKGY